MLYNKISQCRYFNFIYSNVYNRLIRHKRTCYCVGIDDHTRSDSTELAETVPTASGIANCWRNRCTTDNDFAKMLTMNISCYGDLNSQSELPRSIPWNHISDVHPGFTLIT